MTGIGTGDIQERAERASWSAGGREASGKLVNVHKYLKGGSKEHRARLLSLVSSERMRCNGHKLKYKTFQLNIRKSFFYSKGDQALEEVDQRGYGVFILEGIKTWLDTVLY